MEFLRKVGFAFIKIVYRGFGNPMQIRILRMLGVKIGKNCNIRCYSFSPESYLIEIGDHVSIARGTKLITHEGASWVFRNERPKIDSFGTIKIGNNCFIGMNCLILPNTKIGDNCIIGAGSVVRGIIPDNSVVSGNPCKVLMTTNAYKIIFNSHPGTSDFLGLDYKSKKKMLLKQYKKP